jgi:hypothetical protein
MNKNGLEMGFAWMFAIIVGVVIILLAIYFATQIIGTGQREVNTKVAVEFSNVLDPLQTVVSESSGNNVPLPVEAQIFISCETDGNFGNTIVSFSERIGFQEEWSQRGGEIRTQNAYLFSEDILQGRDVDFLIFPFEMPYKVGDVLISYTDNYCFVNSPLESDLRNLVGEDDKRVVFRSTASSCPSATKTVCFEGSCDINVRCNDLRCNTGSVNKGNDFLRFTDNLVYGAIFSSKENYECNTNRLMKRLSIVSKIYSDKSRFSSNRGCNNLNLRPDILALNASSANYNSLDDLNNIRLLANSIDEKNEELECQLY